MIDNIALFASVVLPLWNIPLIVRIIKRRSSNDISIFWAIGVWACLFLMLPSGIRSQFIVWRAFTVANFGFFTIVAFVTTLFHKRER